MNNYKLAISETKLKTALQLQGKALNTFLQSLRYDEIASIMVLPELIKSFDEFASDKTKLFNYLNNVLTKLVPALLEQSTIIWQLPKPTLDGISSSKLFDCISRLPVSLLSDEEINRREHLSQAGLKWRTQVEVDKPTHLGDVMPMLSPNGQELAYDSQIRFVNDYLACHDEPTIAQGFAGIGKTTMLAFIINGLKSRYKAKPLYVAQNQQQLQHFRGKGLSIPCMTFSSAINIEFSQPHHHLTKDVDHKKSASYFSFEPLGHLNSYKVYLLANTIVKNFCFSDDSYISENHLPNSGVTNKNQHIINATLLWRTITSMSPSTPVNFEWVHKMKIISLGGQGFRKLNATHLLLDEGHDIFPAFKKILRDTKTPYLVLKDDLQNLSASKFKAGPNHRNKEISHSIRQGVNIQPFMNVITGSSYYDFHLPFSANLAQKTIIKEYSYNYTFPEIPCSILTGKVYGLLNIIFKLKAKGYKYTFEPQSKIAMIRFVDDAILLNQGNSHKVSSPILFGVSNWDEFFSRNKLYSSHEKLRDFLSSNKRLSSFKKELEQASIEHQSTSYRVGFVDHVKSTEFKSVFLCEDLFQGGYSESNYDINDPYLSSKLYKQQNLINRIYLGVSRATQEIYMPYDYHGRAQDLVHQVSKLSDTLNKD